MPVSTETMDNEPSCNALVKCGTSVRVTAVALNIGEYKCCMHHAGHALHCRQHYETEAVRLQVLFKLLHGRLASLFECATRR